MTLARQLSLLLCAGALASAQKAAAPIDLTGNWVSVITEDWRYRMVTPPKGDYPSVPLNAAGKRIADAWDPAKDEAAGEQCKSYGAGNFMRLPGRFRISWDNETTLKVETDYGTQTRLLHFDGTPSNGDLGYQGWSTATWEGGGGRRGANKGPSGVGDLKVVTTRMKPGYLQKNGVPISNSAIVTEYFHRIGESNGDSWMVVTTMVEDPVYLTGQFQRSSHYKLERDGSKWSPEPCSAR